MTYTIRLALENDLDALTDVENSAMVLFSQVGLSWISEAPPLDRAFLYERMASENLWVAADISNQPAGFIVGKEMDGFYFIYELSVSQEHQRKGLGRRLAQKVMDYAHENAYPAITLTTYRDLPWNGPFYNSLGFREIMPSPAIPELSAKLEKEIAFGHARERRCIMIRELPEATD